MGEMSEIDILVRNYINEYRKDTAVERGIKRRFVAIQAFAWQLILEEIQKIESEKEKD